jgi:hypothetical protein
LGHPDHGTTEGAAATPKLHAVNEGGHIILVVENANIECASAGEGTVISHGGAGVPATFSVSNLSFTGCTSGWTVTTNTLGDLSVTWTSGHDGTLSAGWFTMTAVLHTIFGDTTCRYMTSSTHIGTVIGGNPGTVKLESPIPLHSGGGFCGSGGSQMKGFYVTTSALYVANS